MPDILCAAERQDVRRTLRKGWSAAGKCRFFQSDPDGGCGLSPAERFPGQREVQFPRSERDGKFGKIPVHRRVSRRNAQEILLLLNQQRTGSRNGKCSPRGLEPGFLRKEKSPGTQTIRRKRRLHVRRVAQDRRILRRNGTVRGNQVGAGCVFRIDAVVDPELADLRVGGGEGEDLEEWCGIG